jgi:hypothetical protein
MKLISVSIPDRKSSTSYHIKKNVGLQLLITTVVSFPFISNPVVAMVSLADAVQDMPLPEMIHTYAIVLFVLC